MWVVAGLRSHRAQGCSIGDRDAENKEILKKKKDGEKEREKEEEGRERLGVGLNVKYSRLGSRALE